MNRYYGSNLGRFLTPDPYGGSGKPTMPQTWNRYTYVANDPVNLTDRLGLDPYDNPDIGFSATFVGWMAVWMAAAAGPGAFQSMGAEGPTFYYPLLTPLLVLLGNPASGGHERREKEPECFAQLKYRDVKDVMTPANHSFWWVQDRSGQRYIISGGKETYENNEDNAREYLRVWVVEGDANGDDNSQKTVHWSSGLSAEICGRVDQMLNAARGFPRRTISYYPVLGPNSNSAARYIGENGGFTPSSPPLAVGWDTLIPGL